MAAGKLPAANTSRRPQGRSTTMSVEPERTFPHSGTTKPTAVSRPLYAAKISRKYGASFQLQSEWFALIIAERQPLGKIFAKNVSGGRESPDPGKRNAQRQEPLGAIFLAMPPSPGYNWSRKQNEIEYPGCLPDGTPANSSASGPCFGSFCRSRKRKPVECLAQSME